MREQEKQDAPISIDFLLADRIEQFMFERGEYDFSADDTIRWIGAERDETVRNICRALNDDPAPLLKYFIDEEAVMDEEDELLPVLQELIQDFIGYQEKGYDFVRREWFDVVQVQKDQTNDTFENDDEAVEQAKADGFRIIPVDELPVIFSACERREFWVDTPDNRDNLVEYGKFAVVSTICDVLGSECLERFDTANARNQWVTEDFYQTREKLLQTLETEPEVLCDFLKAVEHEYNKTEWDALLEEDPEFGRFGCDLSAALGDVAGITEIYKQKNAEKTEKSSDKQKNSPELD